MKKQIFKILFSILAVTLLLFSFNSIQNTFAYEENINTAQTTNYTISGKWQFPQSFSFPNLESDFYEEVNFTFADESYYGFQLNDTIGSVLYFNDERALSVATLTRDETTTTISNFISNIIDFGETEQEVSEAFYIFINTNATKIEAYNLHLLSNGTTFTSNTLGLSFEKGSNLSIYVYPSENYELLESNISVSGTYDSYSYDRIQGLIVILNASSDIYVSVYETLIPSIQTIYEASLKINLLDVIEDNNSLQLKVNIPLSLTGELQLTSVNISKTEELNIKNYKLTLVEEKSNEEFSIYLVKDFVLETSESRLYIIPSLFRTYNATIDGEQAEDQTITEKAIEVSAKYTFEDDDKGTKVTYSGIEVITVTNKYVGFVRYENGFLSLKSSCDAHFIAFSTDLDIDKLLEADVYYTTQSYSYRKGGTIIITENETYGDINENYVHLTNGETAEYLPGGWFSQYYSWYRITSVEDFISYLKGLNIGVDDNSQLDDETMKELLKNSWVLSFAETEYYEGIINTATATNGIDKTIVGDVSILRLAFETVGQYYNLATTDDKVTGSEDPVVTVEPEVNIWEEVKEFFVNAWEFIKTVLKTIWETVKEVYDKILYVILALLAIIIVILIFKNRKK